MLLQIAVQIGVVFAKVARYDYPQAWPSLFSDLLAKLQSADMLTTRRVYLVLHHILKELSTKRLAGDQRNFAEVRPPFSQDSIPSLVTPANSTRRMHWDNASTGLRALVPCYGCVAFAARLHTYKCLLGLRGGRR